MPRVFATLGRGLDLSLSASRELRRASLYIGLLTLGLLGPFVAILVAYGAAQGGFDWVVDAALGIQPDLVPVDDSVPVLLVLTGVIGLCGYIAVALESQIMAAAILSGRAIGRPLTLKEALRRSRQVFWRVVRASILVAMILIIPSAVLNVALQSALGANSEAASIVATAVGAVISAPFAYLVAGIVLGDVGGGEAVRRSLRLARVRWRLAVSVASISAVVAYIQLFAFSAGADILARIGSFLHVGFESGTSGTLALGAVVMLGVLSLGSLTFTLSALIVAPQVVAFLALTGYSAGIERSRQEQGDRQVKVRWMTIPMTIGVVVGVLAAAAAVSSLA